MLRDNAVLKKVIAEGEARVGKLASQLLSNEKLMEALQRTVTAALEAKGAIERNVKTALASMNIPTAAEVKTLRNKVAELERVFERLTAQIAELQKKRERAATAPGASSSSVSDEPAQRS